MASSPYSPFPDPFDDSAWIPTPPSAVPEWAPDAAFATEAAPLGDAPRSVEGDARRGIPSNAPTASGDASTAGGVSPASGHASPEVPPAPPQAMPHRAPRRASLLVVAALCALTGAGAGAGAGAFAALSIAHPATTTTTTTTSSDASADAVAAVARMTASASTAASTTAPSTTAPSTTGTGSIASTTPASISSSNSTDTTVEAVAASASPSVVTIDATTTTSGGRFFGGTVQVADSGSGVIISSDGWILTNHHVVGSAKTVTVILADGSKLSGTVKAVDSTTDFALVKVTATGLTAATLGDSSSVKVGQTAIAIGSPLGQFTGTVTSGIVSGLDRSITVASDTSPNGTNLSHLIQTDAAINPGNSGGPLLNLAGQVIGINTAEAGNAQNIGFSLPINLAKDLIAKNVV